MQVTNVKTDKISNERSFMYKMVLIYPLRIVLYLITILIYLAILQALWVYTADSLAVFLKNQYGLTLSTDLLLLLAIIVAIIFSVISVYLFRTLVKMGLWLHSYSILAMKLNLSKYAHKPAIAQRTEAQNLEFAQNLQILGQIGLYFHLPLIPFILLFATIGIILPSSMTFVLILPFAFSALVCMMFSTNPFFIQKYIFNTLEKLRQEYPQE